MLGGGGGVTRVLAVDMAGAFDKVSRRGVVHKANFLANRPPALMVQKLPIDKHQPQTPSEQVCLKEASRGPIYSCCTLMTLTPTFAGQPALPQHSTSVVGGLGNLSAVCDDLQITVNVLAAWGAT